MLNSIWTDLLSV